MVKVEFASSCSVRDIMGPDCCASCTAEDSDSSLGSLDSRVSLIAVATSSGVNKRPLDYCT